MNKERRGLVTGRSWYEIRAARGKAEVAILKNIGDFGVSSADFYEELRALGGNMPLDVRIASDGGNVTQGMAIYHMLRAHKAKVTVFVDGVAASIASVIAMAGDEVVMPENALLMLHEPVGGVIGRSVEARRLATALDAVRDSMVTAYAAKSGQDESVIRDMMEEETWLTADAAVELGFADRVDEPLAMAAQFDLTKFKHAPVVAAASTESSTMTTKVDDKTLAALKAELADEVRKDVETEVRASIAAEVKAKAAVDAAALAAKNGEVITETVEQITTRVRAELNDRAKQITALCALAGHEDKAPGFIASTKTEAEVVAELGKLRGENDEVSARHDPIGKGRQGTRNGKASTMETKEIDPAAIYARWNSAGKRATA